MTHVHTEPTRNKLELVFLIFPALYLIDLFLGFNVHIITVPGVPGVNLLLALVSMYAYAIFAFVSSGKGDIGVFFRCFFGAFDLMVFLFIFLNLLWAVVVPLFSGGTALQGLSEGRVFLALMLYFPCVLLCRMGYIDWERVLTFALVLTAALAILHLVLYVGEKIFESTDYAGLEEQYRGHGGFAAIFFDFFSKIRLGSSVKTPQIIMGSGYIRVIYPTSVLLLMGLYLIFRRIGRIKVGLTALFVVFTIAVCATLTKTLWLGVLIGIVAYIICMFSFLKPFRKSILLLLLTGIVAVTVTNYMLFDGMVLIRLENAFIIEQGTPDEDISDEAAGTIEANNIRLEQTEKLLAEWGKSPVFGYGYGHFLEDYIRSEETLYSYEMLIPAMLMKLGVLGILIWGAFIIFVFVHILKRSNKHPAEAGALIFILLSFMVAVQNNPMLMNFNGMTLLAFILTDSALMGDLTAPPPPIPAH